MANPPCFDWSGYFRGLRDEETHALAAWLAAEGLGVSEFMELVDRAYAAAPDHRRGRPARFVARFGRPAAGAYAHRKRRFAGQIAALELAHMSGALCGEVRPEELDPFALPPPEHRRAEALLGVLARARNGRA